jgi:hypothetical protein
MAVVSALGTTISAGAASRNPGYWLVSRDGGVFAFGGAPFLGSATEQCTLQCFGIGATGDGDGYWVVDNFSFHHPGLTNLYGFGDAAPVTIPSLDGGATAVASTPSGTGGWVLYGQVGTVEPFGDAKWFGDGTAIRGCCRTWPGFGSGIGYFAGIASTPDGGGYWLVGLDGGVFAYGDANFYGSLGGRPLNAPVAGIARTSDGHGYWLVSLDGGIFAFGDAQFAGSMGGTPLNALMIGVAGNPGGPGYWTVGQDGGVFAFGGAPFLGSMADHKPQIQPVFGIAANG